MGSSTLAPLSAGYSPEGVVGLILHGLSLGCHEGGRVGIDKQEGWGIGCQIISAINAGHGETLAYLPDFLPYLILNIPVADIANHLDNQRCNELHFCLAKAA